MIRLLLPNTDFVGSFIATSPSISMQQINLSMTKYLVLVTHSSKKSNRGFRINKVYNPTYHSRNIIDGGPIGCGKDFFMIHTNDFMTEDTKKINSECSYTAIPNQDYPQTLETRPEQYLIVTGHMSWHKDQLEEEMLNGIWMGIKFDMNVLFHTPIVNKWNKAYDLSGIIPERIGLYDADL